MKKSLKAQIRIDKDYDGSLITNEGLKKITSKSSKQISIVLNNNH